MTKLKLSESARKARGLPVSIEPATPPTLSKKQQRKLAQKELFNRNLAVITERVNSLSIDDANTRLACVKSALHEINRDVKLYEAGRRDMPKLILSGFAHEIWIHRAIRARGYFLHERRLLINLIKGGVK